MLHLVFKSPHQSSGLMECLSIASSEDAILLLEDAVVAVLKDNQWQKLIDSKKDQIFVLQDDLNARGVNEFLMEGIKLVDIKGFVELTEQHITQISW